VEGHVVRRTGIGRRQRGRAQIRKRLQPLAEIGPRRLVALHIYTAYFAGAVVEVEIHRQILVLGTLGQYSCRTRGRVTAGVSIIAVAVRITVAPRAGITIPASRLGVTVWGSPPARAWSCARFIRILASARAARSVGAASLRRVACIRRGTGSAGFGIRWV